MKWEQLLSLKRQGDTSKRLRIEQDDTRLGFEVDYDRVIFSSEFRSLQDKTQVIPFSKTSIQNEDYEFVNECAKKYFALKKHSIKTLKYYQYDLAILVNDEEVTPPSDKKALSLFKKAAEEIGFYVEFIAKKVVEIGGTSVVDPIRSVLGKYKTVDENGVFVSLEATDLCSKLFRVEFLTSETLYNSSSIKRSSSSFL